LAASVLALVPNELIVRQALPGADRIVLITRPRSEAAACPLCKQVSRRVHSHYQRRLVDLPWQGRIVELRVEARRFRCPNPGCSRSIFTERLGEAAAANARRTTRLRDVQRQIALAAGGKPGARLAERLAMPVSGATLLRLIRAQMAAPQAGPRVLGIDDWAWRRGHRYGTILVDLERNTVIDLLPDRQAETVAGWLREHPGIQFVARDRAGAYADGIRQGAPNAIQVADRWHLLRNLGDAMQAVVDRHHALVRRTARQVIDGLLAEARNAQSPSPRPTAAEIRSREAYARRQARYEEAAQLRARGLSLSRIADLLGTERKVIRRWLRLGHAPQWSKPARQTVLDAHREYLEQRWAAGCRNAAQLWRELVEQGFRGRPTIVRAWAGRRRKTEPDPNANPRTVQGAVWKPPSAHRITRLLMADSETLAPADQAFVAQLVQAAPALAKAAAVAKRLSLLFRRKSNEILSDVLAAANETLLAGFADSLRKDHEAVFAALNLPWTTSPAEGQINRLKMIKRTMFGRANLDLLRHRILAAA
jgi:transposase